MRWDRAIRDWEFNHLNFQSKPYSVHAATWNQVRATIQDLEHQLNHVRILCCPVCHHTGMKSFVSRLCSSSRDWYHNESRGHTKKQHPNPQQGHAPKPAGHCHCGSWSCRGWGPQLYSCSGYSGMIPRPPNPKHRASWAGQKFNRHWTTLSRPEQAWAILFVCLTMAFANVCWSRTSQSTASSSISAISWRTHTSSALFGWTFGCCYPRVQFSTGWQQDRSKIFDPVAMVAIVWWMQSRIEQRSPCKEKLESEIQLGKAMQVTAWISDLAIRWKLGANRCKTFQDEAFSLICILRPSPTWMSSMVSTMLWARPFLHVLWFECFFFQTTLSNSFQVDWMGKWTQKWFGLDEMGAWDCFNPSGHRWCSCQEGGSRTCWCLRWDVISSYGNGCLAWLWTHVWGSSCQDTTKKIVGRGSNRSWFWLWLCILIGPQLEWNPKQQTKRHFGDVMTLPCKLWWTAHRHPWWEQCWVHKKQQWLTLACFRSCVLSTSFACSTSCKHWDGYFQTSDRFEISRCCMRSCCQLPRMRMQMKILLYKLPSSGLSICLCSFHNFASVNYTMTLHEHTTFAQWTGHIDLRTTANCIFLEGFELPNHFEGFQTFHPRCISDAQIHFCMVLSLSIWACASCLRFTWFISL